MSRGPPYYRAGLADLTLRLQNSLPDPEILAIVMRYARQWNGVEDLVEASAETHDRHAAWIRRIEQSRIRLYERLYGNDRRPPATRGTHRP